MVGRESVRASERAAGKLEYSGTASFSLLFIFFSDFSLSFLRILFSFPWFVDTLNRGESFVGARLMQIEAEIFSSLDCLNCCLFFRTHLLLLIWNYHNAQTMHCICTKDARPYMYGCSK